ncbi:tripartite tricarboxylate transporter TctB family protein [Tianweitania sp. BSSL-BM11]|uniref:Tripartite tricarboxylate transporter TctB family protein n=1 Tax=Tianweitania aestuarii TaxID=2814886 RepID=A0ABS5RQD2_9HYPH|nr:tripartite tricarboxylate transporter TctB family protein [Tianweitania aestuarii]MBS9719216.1 tripartite tricarboxylate transporter TctB family protein [Tianweitania aestuarii]
MSVLDDNPTRERRPDWAAFAIAIVLGIASAAIAWSTYNAGGIATTQPVGPKTVPYIVAACLFGLAIWTAVEALRGDFPEREEQQTAPIIWVVGGLIVQMLTIKTIGFSLATALMFTATAYAFNERRVWLTLPFGLVFCFLVWLAFARGLQLSLPAGPLERLF